MARFSDRLSTNVDGDFFVDSSCIDCDLCRQIAPDTFGRDDRAGQSIVCSQPGNDAARHRALMALVTCPTSSIGTTRKIDSRAAARSFPEQLVDEVYFCGWASEDSYGAASWFVRRPDGNVLVDSPRASKILMERLEELGGVRWMFLTHRDDVADHRAYRDRFGCTRVLHRADLSADTRDVELVLDGQTALAPDLLAIPVPGHTRGSCALLYRDTFLFSGDHLWSDEAGGIEAGKDVCWYSWPTQKRSVALLSEYPFEWVIPGHGRPFHAASRSAMRAEILRVARIYGISQK